jgi:hypothetical protein
MATRLNTQMPTSAPRTQNTEGPGLFRRIGQTLKALMVTPDAPKETITRSDTFRMGTPTFQAAAKQLISNSNGNSFDGRKIDPNARSARDQALLGWLNTEFIDSKPATTLPARRNPSRVA